MIDSEERQFDLHLILLHLSDRDSRYNQISQFRYSIEEERKEKPY